ncbi:mechanosensitive ion channel [Candidatus Pacearchaeota archaeon]|nr:mechanosensitive ion channel [Candidatus Pacearchaeota archaeon]
MIGFGLWTVFVLISLSILISNVTALIASLGLVGFGLTFALQKPILNFVGWLVLIFKRIYSEGDRIRIGSISGDVKEIQVMNTVLDGLLENSNLLSGKIVTFPNELVLTSDVENYTKESNYIREELSISITFESNYHKAVKLLKEIITVHVRKNKEKYIKKVAKKTNEVNVFINKMLKSKGKTKKQQVENDIEAERLKKEKEQMENELKDIDKEFIPKIRVELLDSSIQLIAQFLTPYNHIKKNRTEINLAFLDAIRKEKDIEIAYPHMQVIQDGKK